MRAVLVEYGPGAASPSHRHPSSAFIYATVLEGEIRSKVNDEPEHVYKAGESWTEMPGDHHKVSANASSTKPARQAGHIHRRYDGARDCHPRQIATLRWLDVVRSALGHEGTLNALTSMFAFSLLADVFANS